MYNQPTLEISKYVNGHVLNDSSKAIFVSFTSILDI